MLKNLHRCEVQVMRTVLMNEKAKVALHGFSNNIQHIHYLNEFVHSTINASEGKV